MRGLHPRLFFVRSWREINESAFGPAARPGRRSGATVDHRVVVVFLVTAFSLTLMEYFGHRGTLLRWQPDWLLGRYGELHGFAYWAFWRVFGYAVIPALAVIVTPGMRLRECGISFKGFLEHLWIYLLLFVFVLAMVLFVSFKSDFAAYYPFYKQAHLSWFDLLAWEFLYALQFLSLEFFFRGFMLHPLKRSLGAYAILAMVVPYCMIHYGKPFLEANAAIVAGVVLGTLSLRTGSIWCGALIHITVAVSMDLAALYQAGHLPSLVAG
jgi:membrane protease YdiL (CAAX protease family)